ncbi:hypothetical protein J23TS9_01590 [Paenibacillus sp. J23TS9]|uniref:hypothetical protein n=1 Tax=Paenibacillus sp. J23TS9 TaxID=2807193 RepID=UPI001B1B1489|nr:hypothetical protein [Paenibacillus sp. J23TS9]GIP25029.1 hypothetical protein J23TS9_01590 [Paenibacillus sp. J23TS9]
MSMNIFKARKGSKVRFTGQGGWGGEAELASKKLTEGTEYIIDRVEIYQSSTDVYLEGFGDYGFNSVHFTDVFETKDGIEYGKICDLTNADFTHFVMDEIENVTRLRELERVVISIDDFGCDPDESEEIDAPTIVVDVKVRGALWTFWFDTDEGKYDYDVLNDRTVERYLAIKSGNEPELPSIYTYRPKEELI